ncbi:MAG: nuclear transport factor 2 family protein [Azonexus sp.]|jgi:hypothetical protein|nr:nuclear transport factor 2 family protein [Azonexus sp.]
MTQPDNLQALLDAHAITQLVARYGRAVDWLDIPGMKACFADAATVHFGELSLAAHEFCDFWNNMGSACKARHHLFGLPVIAMQSADTAVVDVPSLAACTRVDAGVRLRDFAECNRYVWHVERTAEGWKIRDAQIFIVWSQGAPTPTGIEAGMPLDHDVTMQHPAFVAL